MNFYFYRNVRVIEEKSHILLHGTECVGKKTLATRLVQHVLDYDMSKCPFTHEYFKVDTSTNKTSELNVWMRTGKYHIELDFYNTQVGYDTYLINHILKNLEYVKLNNECEFQQFYVLLFHFEKASIDTQYMLRRILEKLKYVTFVITTRCASKILDSVKSRFYCARIPKTFDVPEHLHAWKETIPMFSVDPTNVKDIIVMYRKCTYNNMINGVETIHILKHLWSLFTDSGLFDNHALVVIFARASAVMTNSTKHIYHIEHAVYQSLTTALLEK